MSCTNCVTSGYTKLHKYNPPVVGKFSYACDGHNCHVQHVAPGPGSYSNMQECQKKCGGHPGPVGGFSYKCDGKVCFLQNTPPGPGSYSNIQQCQKNCGGHSGPTGHYSSDYYAGIL